VAYGSYDDTNASYRINVPITTTLAGMIVASFQNRDGWVWNPVKGKNEGDSNQYGVKGKLSWKPTDAFNAYLSVDYRRAHISPNFLSTYRALGLGAGSVPPGFGILSYGIVPGTNNTETAISSSSFRNTQTGGASLELNYKLGDYTLTALSAYRQMVKNAYATLGGTPIVYAEGPSHSRANQISQELRLTSPSGRLSGIRQRDLLLSPAQQRYWPDRGTVRRAGNGALWSGRQHCLQRRARSYALQRQQHRGLYRWHHAVGRSFACHSGRALHP
jgi:iron complex outermembrane receptor protein